MAFIGVAQSWCIPNLTARAFPCASRSVCGSQGKPRNPRTVTMSAYRDRSLSRASKLSLAVCMAVSVSLRSATAASIVREAPSPIVDASLIHLSPIPAHKDPSTAIRHVDYRSATGTKQVLSAGGNQAGDASDHAYSRETLNAVQHQSEEIEGGHKSLGQRIADKLRSRGLPDELVVFLVSALPVVELRAGVPIGFVLNLHPIKVFLLAVLGNMAPIIPLMLLLRWRLVQTVAAKVLDRARKKASAVGNANSRAAALALFVGVPLPGTGAWTGSLVAFVLGMPVGQSLLALSSGVVMAACIMTVLCAMGKVGAVFAGTVLLGAGISSMVKANSGIEGNRNDERGPSDATETS